LESVTYQKRTARDVFTRSTESYATRKAKVDRQSHETMIWLSQVEASDSVLEIACGPAFVSLRFAEKAKSVVGIDLAQLGRAARIRNERGLRNLSFIEGDVESLPFQSGSFQIVACHKALHHFSRPKRVLLEVRQVLTEDGELVLGDSLSSDEPEKNALLNEIERLRDPSHVKMYGLKELTSLVSLAGFKIERYEVLEDEREFGWWMSVIQPPPEVVTEIRKRISQAIQNDGTGLHVRLEGEKLWMRRRSVVLVASKA
jgi:ubiquinone/menaquinone biosynthesis C-methylase UbiE